MRAATAVYTLAATGPAGDAQRASSDAVLSACHGAFAANFVRYDLPIGAAATTIPMSLTMSWIALCAALTATR